MPPVFVLLWSTGFIGSKFGLPYAEPFTFLSLRFAIAATALTLLSLYARAPWPNTFVQIRDAVIVGVLMHVTYLGGVFLGISLGTGAGISAVITGLQPILIAALAIPFLAERVSKLQAFGLNGHFAIEQGGRNASGHGRGRVWLHAYLPYLESH